MTASDLNSDGSKAAAMKSDSQGSMSGNADEKGQENINDLPSYSDLNSIHHSPRVSTIPITSSMVSDEEPIDIRLDDDPVTSSYANTSGQNQNNDHSSTSKHYNNGPSIWLTPARSASQVTYDSYNASQVYFEATKPNRSLSTIPALSNSLPNAEQGESSQSSDIASSQAKLTLENLTEALPHPTAIYHPGTSQWQVVLDEEEFARGYRDTSKPEAIEITSNDFTLWRSIDVIEADEIDKGMHLVSIPPIEIGQSQVAWKVVKQFHRWQSTAGKFVYSTIPEALNSVVPTRLLDAFKNERMSNPRPSVTGIAQFQDSGLTLLKIVGNAANGETRSLMISGVTISTKLGMDQHTEGILTCMGFTQSEQTDDQTGMSKKVVRPPDISSKHLQIRLRRAWIELVLWFTYEASLLPIPTVWDSIQKSDVPFLPQSISATEYLCRVFGDSGTSSKQDVPHDLLAELAGLGLDGDASDEMVQKVYELNTTSAGFIERIEAFSTLQRLVENHRTHSDALQTLVAIERSKPMYTKQEILSSYTKVIGEPIDTLEKASQIDDSFIGAMFQVNTENVVAEPSEVQSFKDALQIVSWCRGRPASLEAVLEKPIEFSLEKAYEVLGVTAETDDDFIASVYSIAATDKKHTEAECIEALRVISKNRKSTALSKVYRNATGQEEALDWEMADTDKPAGLNNIGNTCYLNSVLQYFYAIKPIRERILGAGQVAVETKKVINAERMQVGGRKVSQREIDRSHQFVKLLSQLFSAMMTSPITAITPERELAYLALVSSAREESLTEFVEEDGEKGASSTALEGSHNSAGTDTTLVEEPKTYNTDVDGNTQDNTAEPIGPQNAPDIPSAARPPALPSRPLLEHTEAGQRRNSLMQVGAQQDVSECLDNVMFQVEAALTAQEIEDVSKTANISESATKDALNSANEDEWTTEGDLLRRLFLGRTQQRLELQAEEEQNDVKGGSIHMKKEVFKILPIVVMEEEGKDIHDGLDGFFAEEILTHASGRPMTRAVSLIDPPAVLQIQLQRVQFDRKKGRSFKSQAHLAFEETIYMDRYMDFDLQNADDRKRNEKRKEERVAREKIAALHARIRSLKPTEEGSKVAARALERSASYLSSLPKIKHPLNIPNEKEDVSDDEENVEAPAGGIPEELLEGGISAFLESESKRVEEEIKEAEESILELKTGIESLWVEERRVEYVLASVFMHRGEASHGHYFLNQRKLGPKVQSEEQQSAPSTWFKYNDNVVQEIAVGDVLKDKTGATPYLLSFVRKDLQDEMSLFDTICRYVDNGVPNATDGLVRQDVQTDTKMDEGKQEKLENGQGQENHLSRNNDMEVEKN
ncbi:cysteine proteinase [Meira miltonrushii]|uniref:ubiquitinyl hydrolase 1 n=1 Tax=Meira miltonrushii TaxID=1280837 RepID=A0A316VET4_9BASI|nr:cysteine proteinase [Meira miltonrushii]PWN34823.1 cysteine proteinase [Meira miltonrushii]